MLLGIIRLMTSMKLASGLAPASVRGESPGSRRRPAG